MRQGNYCRGKDHYRWNGGMTCDYRGVILVRAKEHPRADARGYVRQHILIAEAALGKYLVLPACVHHHTPTQLVICQDNAYHKLLHRRTNALKACGHADWLKCKFCKCYDAPENLRTYKRGKHRYQSLHLECLRKIRQEHRR